VFYDLTITECYVGHTTNFAQRKRDHKKGSMNEKGKRYFNKLYTSIRANGGWFNHCMIELEKYPCNDANEATAKEREYYELLNSDLNSQYPGRSRAQYKSEHKVEAVLRNRKWRETNKEKIKEKLCREHVCDCGRVMQYMEKTRHFKTKFHTDYIHSSAQAMEYVKKK
jgi:hypothetical protein